MDVDELTVLFISEILLYVDCDDQAPVKQISARAGVIKTASETDGPTGVYHRLFSAAAAASIRTGAPILSHTEMGMHAMEQVELFRKLGVPAENIILCHIDRSLKYMQYQLRIAETGVFIELDTIGRHKYHSDEEEGGLIWWKEAL